MKYYGYIKAKTKEESEKKRVAIIEYTQLKNIEINFIKTFENLEESSEIFIDSLCSLGNTVYQILNIFF